MSGKVGRPMSDVDEGNDINEVNERIAVLCRWMGDYYEVK